MFSQSRFLPLPVVCHLRGTHTAYFYCKEATPQARALWALGGLWQRWWWLVGPRTNQSFSLRQGQNQAIC